jgi:hypothetical protein
MNTGVVDTDVDDDFLRSVYDEAEGRLRKGLSRGEGSGEHPT